MCLAEVRIEGRMIGGVCGEVPACKLLLQHAGAPSGMNLIVTWTDASLWLVFWSKRGDGAGGVRFFGVEEVFEQGLLQ